MLQQVVMEGLNMGISEMVMTDIAMDNGPVEMVSFPIKHGDFPQLCKCSPEGLGSDYVSAFRRYDRIQHTSIHQGSFQMVNVISHTRIGLKLKDTVIK